MSNTAMFYHTPSLILLPFDSEERKKQLQGWKILHLFFIYHSNILSLCSVPKLKSGRGNLQSQTD
uniref:Uncharacterized protein n=1 Tax=Cyclopterus lumpus TaxID=8103 RepID=A0A8C2XBS9_CYCLU